MEIALPVLFAILGMLEIGSALARSAPPEWALGELILLAGSYVLVRECMKLWEGSRKTGQPKQWFTEPSRDHGKSFSSSERDARTRLFEETASRRGAGGDACDIGENGIGESGLAAGGELRASHSVEQIALAMITYSFRQLSLRYHPDHGGDPEVMRRIYAAREMILRAIRTH